MRSAPHRSNQILIPSLDLEFCLREIGGGKGIRTPDLLIANETLYQLSYTPREAEHDITPRQNFSNDSARLQFFTALVKPKTNYEIENLPFHRGDHSPPLFRANLGADRFAFAGQASQSANSIPRDGFSR